MLYTQGNPPLPESSRWSVFMLMPKIRWRNCYFNSQISHTVKAATKMIQNFWKRFLMCCCYVSAYSSTFQIFAKLSPPSGPSLLISNLPLSLLCPWAGLTQTAVTLLTDTATALALLRASSQGTRGAPAATGKVLIWFLDFIIWTFSI